MKMARDDKEFLLCFFAGQAMQGMIMNNQGPSLPLMVSEPMMEQLVSGAARYAKALLKELEAT